MDSDTYEFCKRGSDGFPGGRCMLECHLPVCTQWRGLGLYGHVSWHGTGLTRWTSVVEYKNRVYPDFHNQSPACLSWVTRMVCGLARFGPQGLYYMLCDVMEKQQDTTVPTFSLGFKSRMLSWSVMWLWEYPAPAPSALDQFDQSLWWLPSSFLTLLATHATCLTSLLKLLIDLLSIFTMTTTTLTPITAPGG